MAIKSVMQAIATLLGIEIQDYNSSIASYSDSYADSLDDIADSADNATSSIKALKLQTLGFDQINNINESDSSSGGSSGVSVGGGGIDQRLLDAMEGYDNAMDSVRMKATEIRDKIMEWLGFTKKIDPLTKEISWEYKGLKTTLKNLVTWFKKLNTAGKIFVALGIVKTITLITSAVKKLIGTNLLSSIKNLLTPISKLVTTMKDYYQLTSSVGYSGIERLTATVKDSVDAWSKSLTAIDKLKTSLIGASGLVIGFSLARDAVKEFNEQGQITSGVITNLGTSLATSAVSGALLGASFGGFYGALAGGLLGSLSTLIGYLTGLESETDKLNKRIQESAETSTNYYKSIEENYTKSLSKITANESYFEELDRLVDKNGKIKEGYEDRVKFIGTQLKEAYGVEIKVVDGVIQNYDGYIDSIKKAIAQKKLELLINAKSEAWNKAIEERASKEKDIEDALKNKNKAQEKYNETLEKYSIVAGQAGVTGDFYQGIINRSKKELDKATEAYNTAVESYKENSNTIMEYDDLMTANASGNYDVIMEAIDTYSKEHSSSISTQILAYQSLMEKSNEMTENEKKNFEERYKSLVDSLVSESQTIENMTPEIKEAWKTLANNNYSAYMEEIKKLPPDVQGVLLTDQLNTIEDLTPETVSAWTNLANQDKSAFTNAINELPDDVKKELLGDMSNAGNEVAKDMLDGLSKADVSKETDKLATNTTTKTKDKMTEKVKKTSFWDSFKNSWLLNLSNVIATNGTNSIGENIVKGIVTGMQNNTKTSLFSAWSVGLIGRIKESLGIHSPSRLAMPIGVFTVMGIEEGMEDELSNVPKTATKLIDTLQNTFDSGLNDLSINSALTPTISQNVSTLSNVKTNVNYNSIENASYNGFVKAIKEYGLVQVNVRQDKSSIVETAINGINNITKQTGENPIEMW